MRAGPTVGVVLSLAVLASCGGGETHGESAPERWAATAWGERYEIFAETDPLVAGVEAASGVHVTALDGFAPVAAGEVTMVLRGAAGETVGTSREVVRAGIFRVVIRPEAEGEADLVYRVDGPSGIEEIPAGRVRIGSASAPGGPASDGTHAEGDITFLKEQQWRTRFATAWAALGTLRRSVRGPANVVAAGGGAVEMTSPVDGTIGGSPWPHVGLDVSRGARLVAVTPRVAAERSLAELTAAVADLESQHAAAATRLVRLEALLRAEATSERELAEGRQAERSLSARLTAAQSDLAAARTVRGGGVAAEPLAVAAPFAGRIAAVHVTPGQTVAAGAPLLRLVRPRPVWVTVALTVADAARLGEGIHGLTLRLSASTPGLVVAASDLRLVGQSPEVDASTGTVAVIVEVDRDAAELRIGAAAEAELLLAASGAGIVLPASALVDDGGVAVVYVQATGESFVRREVHPLIRQGDLVLVEGIAAGERVVTVGGAAIRRATLMSSGTIEGHVH